MDARRSAEAPTDPVLTPRLVLTPAGPEDVDDLVLLYGDPMVGYWTGPWTRAAVEAWAADMAASWTADRVGKWMAHDRSDGSLVGRGGFTRIDLDGETALELGWARDDWPAERQPAGSRHRIGWDGCAGRTAGRASR
jgi:RimJ/RimL family protein N-acetyltransferase